MVAEPIRRGDKPHSFEKRSRIWFPPTDTRTRSRTVWLSILSSGSLEFGVPDCGLAAHVAIQLFVEASSSCGPNESNQIVTHFANAFIQQSLGAAPDRIYEKSVSFDAIRKTAEQAR